MRRSLAATLVAAAVGLGLTVPATPAQAVWSCRSWAWYTHGYARCDYGLGAVRVWVRCGNGDVFPGLWANAGETSTAICRNSNVAAHTYETWSG